MEVHERAHTFHVNKAALALQTIPTRLQLDALGNQLNLVATMDGVIHDWLRHYQDGWYNFRCLKVLSFHDVKGDIITNTTAPANPTILLPVQDGNIADCRKQNVKFVRVQLRLDFSTLANAGVTTHLCTLLEEYYIELPLTTKAVTGGNNQAYNLTTIQPFKVASNLAITNRCTAFHWPSLSKLNDKFAPFPWANDDKFQKYIHGDSITKLPVLEMGPPPAAPAHSIPKLPAIHLLMAAIINSVDRLFFVSHSIGANTSREWRLVRIAFSDSMSLYPSCMLDGKFLFEFYICHPSDWRYNAVNQRYWIQYHGQNDIICPDLSSETHLIRPSETSVDYALRHKLLPFRK
jgi:hypothetical protein